MKKIGLKRIGASLALITDSLLLLKEFRQKSAAKKIICTIKGHKFPKEQVLGNCRRCEKSMTRRYDIL